MVVLQLILIVVISAAVLEICHLLWTGLWDRILSIDAVATLQLPCSAPSPASFLVILGVELLETLRGYSAVGRHIMVLDIEHTDGARLTGTATLVVGYQAAATTWMGLAAGDARRRREAGAGTLKGEGEG